MSHDPQIRRPARRLHTGLIAGLLLLGACGTASSDLPLSSPAASQSEGAEDVHYADEAKGFAITHPSDWTEREDENGLDVTFVAPLGLADEFAENLGVLAVGSLPQNTTFAQYEKMGNSMFEEAWGAQVCCAEKIEVGGYPAYLDRYEMEPVPDRPVKGVQWTVLAEDEVFILTYTGHPDGGFDEWLAEGTEIVESFEVI